MASQAFSASANVSKGDPPTLMAGLLISMGRQEATKPGCPRSPGPLITNEKPRSFALHSSNSPVAGPTRLKCRVIQPSASQNGPQRGEATGAANLVGRFSSGRGLGGDAAGSVESILGDPPSSSLLRDFPAVRLDQAEAA